MRYIVTYMDGVVLRLHDGGILGPGEAVLLAKKLAVEGFKQVEIWKWSGEMIKES